MSKDAKLDEFAQCTESDEQGQEWNEAQLQDVAYKRSENVDPQEVELEKHVGLKHISPNDPVPDWEPLDDLSSTKRRFEAGDILFAKLRPNLEKSSQPEFNGVASTDIFPIVAESDVNSKWLLYRLSSKPAFDYARRTSAGTRMPRTSWNLFSNFGFDLPPLPEQRKIATVLYTVDRAIEKTDELVEQYRRLKNGVSQNLLKYGVYEHDLEETDSRFGKLPSSWSLERLVDVTDIVGRTEPPTDVDKYWNGNIPWATPDDIRTLDTPTIASTKTTVTEVALEEVSSNLVPPGSVLLTTRATVGMCAVNEVEMTTSRAFKDLIPGERLDTWYLYYRISTMEDYLNRLGWGSTFTEVIKPVLENVTIPIPSLEEQRAIGDKLRAIDQCIIENIRVKRQYQRMKQGLLQDLLSGTVRTTDTNIEVPEAVAQYG